MYNEHSETAGLRILGFPCNQFGGQEPGSDEDVKKFARVKKLLAEYISTKNRVRVTYYPKSQGFPEKYFPMIGYEESPFLAVKLHFEEKAR